MLCPHKVTKSQCHLAEKNNQHTPKIFMGYCTGAPGFRDLLSSTLAQSSVLNTGPSAPSLPCSNDIPALKRMGHGPHSYCCEAVETTADRELQKAAKKSEAMNLAPLPSGMLPLHQQKGKLDLHGFSACPRHTHGCCAETTAQNRKKEKHVCVSERHMFKCCSSTSQPCCLHSHQNN